MVSVKLAPFCAHTDSNFGTTPEAWSIEFGIFNNSKEEVVLQCNTAELAVSTSNFMSLQLNRCPFGILNITYNYRSSICNQKGSKKRSESITTCL